MKIKIKICGVSDLNTMSTISNLNIDYNLNTPQLDNPLLNTLVQKIPEK